MYLSFKQENGTFAFSLICKSIRNQYIWKVKQHILGLVLEWVTPSKILDIFLALLIPVILLTFHWSGLKEKYYESQLFINWPISIYIFLLIIRRVISISYFCFTLIFCLFELILEERWNTWQLWKGRTKVISLFLLPSPLPPNKNK